MSAYKKLKKREKQQIRQEVGLGQEDSSEEAVQEAPKRQKTEKKEKKTEASEVSEDDSGDDSSEKEEPLELEKSEEGEKAEEVDPEDELRAFKDAEPHTKEWKNRQRVLLITQRSLEGQFRKLLDDLSNLIPHSKQDTKVERKNVKEQIDELCYERSCNNFLYFEQRYHKQSDLYMWLSKSPSGPAFKFLVQHIKPLTEYKLTGNCLRYSRPLLSFDAAFSDPEKPHLQLAKEMFSHIFNTPKNHPKSKPFIDHVLSFHYLDDCIWFRNYQILNQQEEQFTADDDIDKLVLIEIGPRLCLNPIKAFDGSMGGETLWQNPAFITPTRSRSKKFSSFQKKRDYKEKQKAYKEKVMEEGRDPNSYLKEAFKDDDDDE